jgi:elongation factor Ts
MSEVSAQQVSSLRKRTGVPMLAVKKALEEAAGDEEKAIEILRKRGEAQAVKKGKREQPEGNVFSAQSDRKAAFVLIACETDFVARADDFQNAGEALAKTALEQGEEAAKSASATTLPALVNKLGENITLAEVHTIEAPVIGLYVHNNKKIGVGIGLEGGTEELARDAAMHAAAMAPEVVSPEEVSAESVEKEKAIWQEQLTKEGKPEEIQEKIMMGKEKKFRAEQALLNQDFVKEPGKTVGEHLGDATVVAYVRLAV